MAVPGTDLTAATVELLQTLIRYECVNDGTAASGHESRNADVLQSYVEGPGVTIERWEPTPGRASFVARLEGRDPSAPSLCLMGHTDVVPVHADGWRRDPFGGELVTNGEIPRDSTVLFAHLGGQPALNAYSALFTHA